MKFTRTHRFQMFLLASEDFCVCVKYQFANITGKSIFSLNSQIGKSQEEIETGKIFNAYLKQLSDSKSIDSHWETQKKATYEKYKLLRISLFGDLKKIKTALKA